MANKVEADFTIVTSGTAPTATQTVGALPGVAGSHRLVIARVGAVGSKRFGLTAASQADAGVAAFFRLPAPTVDFSNGELILRSNAGLTTFYKAKIINTTLQISKVIASVETVLASVAIASITAKVVACEFMALGTKLQLSTKNLTDGELSFTKQLALNDSSIAGAGLPGFGANMLDGSNGPVVDIDNWDWYNVS